MNLPRVVETPHALREALADICPGLVPTMGALHQGHLSLIERSARENPATVVSIFVNPTQFQNQGDLAKYPRNLERDALAATEAGADLIYAPSVQAVYPEEFATTVSVSGLTDRWEGASRPGHFAGVTTVVSILLNTVRPAHAYFGEKDYQQLQVVRRMHRDLQLPGEIIGCPTLRDVDGLALSSRNSRISGTEREAAIALSQALFAMRDTVNTGDRKSDELLRIGTEIVAAEPLVALDYLAIVDPDSLEPIDELTPGARALIAATIGETRLIDNLALWEPED
jgi:pantoate--beta-alanine ligase